MTDDRPTIAERYQLATHAKRLTLSERSCGEADHLIAAAWSNKLGALLYRLADEYACVAGDIRKAEPDNLTAHLLILLRLKSLEEAKRALGEFACILATKRQFMQPDTVVAALAGRALDAWLSPNCHTCTGRGTMGGAGAPSYVCRACSGTGRRRQALGKTAGERWFAACLLANMEALTAEVERNMGRLLRQHAA